LTRALPTMMDVQNMRATTISVAREVRGSVVISRGIVRS
jgi:hypothetical protein